MSGASGIETAASVSRPLLLLRYKGFRMLWIGQLLSVTGTEKGGSWPFLTGLLNHHTNTGIPTSFC